jgi:hypothetical protein
MPTTRIRTAARLIAGERRREKRIESRALERSGAPSALTTGTADVRRAGWTG